MTRILGGELIMRGEDGDGALGDGVFQAGTDGTGTIHCTAHGIILGILHGTAIGIITGMPVHIGTGIGETHGGDITTTDLYIIRLQEKAQAMQDRDKVYIMARGMPALATETQVEAM